MPPILDKFIQRASELRVHFVYFGRSVGAGSEIDGDRLPNTAMAALAYMPRALAVGLFAPFPDTWGQRVTLPRLTGAIETACWYLACLGVVISVARYRSRKLLAGAIFCAALITLLAYVHPNIGTLYRQRFGLWHFFMLVGCLGWAHLFLVYLRRLYSPAVVHAPDAGLAEHRSMSQTSAYGPFGQGPAVMLITLACYLGFFARDLLLTGELGLGGNLDAFFAAAMIPMVFVGCLAIPLGDALVFPFISARNGALNNSEGLLQGTLSFALLLLVGATCFLLVSAPWLVSLVLRSATEETKDLAVTLVRWFAPIVTLAAWTTVGNAALNSLGAPRFSAMGQLAVPALTLSALVLAPAEQMMAASIGGTLFGTLVNALFVVWKLRFSGHLLLPLASPFALTQDVRRIYWPLAAATVLPSALVPMNYAFAALVSTGMVVAWAFASKMVILFSGLASVGVTSLVLPRMVDLICSKVGQRQQDIRRNSNLSLALGIWLGGALMLGDFLFAEPIVAILLGKGLLAAELRELALIAKVGVMQIPVAIVAVLCNKLSIAVGRSSQVMYSSLLAFAVNSALNLFLVPQVGILGIGAGSLVGGIFSLIVVLVGVYRQIGLSLRDTFVALASFLAWVAVCSSLLIQIMSKIALRPIVNLLPCVM